MQITDISRWKADEVLAVTEVAEARSGIVKLWWAAGNNNQALSEEA